MTHAQPDRFVNVTSNCSAPLTIPAAIFGYDAPQNVLRSFNIAVQVACMIVAGTLFSLRCYVRFRMAKQWILEDWTVLISFLGLQVYSSLMLATINRHAGAYVWELTEQERESALYWFWVETILYGPVIFCTKLAILLIYLRLLVPTRWSILWITIHIFVGISACFYTALTLVKIWQCEPMKRAWQPDIPGSCVNLPLVLQVSGAFNTLSDVFILIVPIKACWNLEISWAKKAGIWAVFVIGGVAPVFSILGLMCRIQATDMYNNPQILLWATAEITTGMICSCLPALPPLVRRPRPVSSFTSPPSSERRSGSDGFSPSSSYLKTCGPAQARALGPDEIDMTPSSSI